MEGKEGVVGRSNRMRRREKKKNREEGEEARRRHRLKMCTLRLQQFSVFKVSLEVLNVCRQIL